MTNAMPGAMTGARARVLALVLVIMLLFANAHGGPPRRSEPRRRLAARTGPDAPRAPVAVARRIRAPYGRCLQLATRPRRPRRCTQRGHPPR